MYVGNQCSGNYKIYNISINNLMNLHLVCIDQCDDDIGTQSVHLSGEGGERGREIEKEFCARHNEKDGT